ncbi:MAG: hypothetical protein SGJ01_06680 [Gemmatimonadota bacterium]|nr:hypothetical protein [Gemmatimonadota bacterium]
MTVTATNARAMNAEQAGLFLAELYGFAEPLSKAAMWRFGRTGQIPVRRLGKRVWFNSEDLTRFYERGGRV